jgi:hypothetical protein
MLWLMVSIVIIVPAAVVNDYLPANLASFTPQQLQTAVKAWNKLGYSNPAVAQAAMRLDQILPHLAPDEPHESSAART